MPEGVEVKLQLEKLKKLIGQNIVSIDILSGRYSRHGPPCGFEKIIKKLPLIIEKIQQKGKFVFMTLSQKWYVLITLGMTGRLILKKNPSHPQKHYHIQFVTPKYILYFYDLRNFGTIQFTDDENILNQKLNKLGFDPLQTKITPTEFISHLHKFPANRKIGELLLDQQFISGIGNYLRADILYCAKIHPKSEIQYLPTNVLKILLKCIQKTMNSSYQRQKLKIKKEYKFIIYKQSKSPLGNPTDKYKDKNGRTIWYVPDEQIYYHSDYSLSELSSTSIL